MNYPAGSTEPAGFDQAGLEPAGFDHIDRTESSDFLIFCIHKHSLLTMQNFLGLWQTSQGDAYFSRSTYRHIEKHLIGGDDDFMFIERHSTVARLIQQVFMNSDITYDLTTNAQQYRIIFDKKFAAPVGLWKSSGNHLLYMFNFSCEIINNY